MTARDHARRTAQRFGNEREIADPGPSLPDRILALDMLTGIALGFIAVVAVRTGFSLYIDIAIALGLVGFLATVAFARFVLSRGEVGEAEPETRRGN